MSTLEKVLKNQTDVLKMQNDTNKKISAMETMLAENLVITKSTYKATRRWFGQNLTKKEEEMSTYIPLTSMGELDVLEQVLSNKENEEAMVSPFISHIFIHHSYLIFFLFYN